MLFSFSSILLVLPCLLLLFLLPQISWSLSNGSSNIPNTFPASTRQALIQKARDLKQSKGCYSSIGWSNRLGSVLTPAAIPGVYTADRPFYWNKIDVGCRMTVIELENSGAPRSKPDLWIHAPVSLDGPLQRLVDELGTVRHIVSPNYEHVSFANQWAVAYPGATLWGCPGMKDKEPDTAPWDCEVPHSAAKSELWPGIQALHVTAEMNPITRKPFFNEVLFYHEPSKSLLTTDFYWNYPQPDGIPNSNLFKEDDFNDDSSGDSSRSNIINSSSLNGPWELAPAVGTIPWTSQLWKFAMDRVYGPFYNNVMVTDATTFRGVQRILMEDWDVETLIPAHGDLIRGKKLIQTVLRQHFGDQHSVF